MVNAFSSAPTPSWFPTRKTNLPTCPSSRSMWACPAHAASQPAPPSGAGDLPKTRPAVRRKENTLVSVSGCTTPAACAPTAPPFAGPSNPVKRYPAPTACSSAWRAAMVQRFAPASRNSEMVAMYQSGRVISWEVYSHNGANYTCGHRLDGSLVCWSEDRSVYVDPTPDSVNAFAAADDDTVCWLLEDHTVACWVNITTGWGNFVMPEGAFRSISLDETVYSAFGCGIRPDGSLSCWGDGDPEWGHLDPPPGEYKAVSTGYGHGCAIRLDDTLVCWGNHHIDTPPEGTFRSINGSGLMHCGVRTDHSVACWGRDDSHLDLSEFLEGAYQSVAVGNFSMVYLCGVRLDGTLRCQGNHQTGEIAPPPDYSNRSAPAAPTPAASG